jgi:hypothetical protein
MATASESADSRDLREEVGLLRAQLNGLLAERAQENTARSVAMAAPAAPIASTPDHAAGDARLFEHVQKVETAFQAEARDPKFARQAADDFRTALTHSEVLQNAFQNIECRSTTCRVEMLDDRSAKFQGQLHQLIQEVGPTLPIMTGRRTVRQDGTPIAVYYWSVSAS